MKVLNVASTTFELYYLSSVGYLLKLAKPNVCLHLLVKPNVAAKLNPELASLYADVKTLELPIVSRRPHRAIARTMEFIDQLHQLDLQVDIVCISAFRNYFANILCRHLADGPRLVALRMCNHECDRLCNEKRPLLSLYYNMFNRLFGASSLEYRFSSDTASNFASWYKRNPYHRTVCISDWGHGPFDSEFRLPPPFIALKQLYGVKDLEREPTILVAGERTPLFGMRSQPIQSLYDSILDFLKQKFAGYRLLFKPRERLTDIQKLKLDGFEIIPPNIPLEELCLRNSYAKVISVKSTACKVAAYCGIPAYVLYPMFQLPPNLCQMLNAYLADMQSVVRVHDLSDLMNDPSAPPQYTIQELSKLYWQAVAEGIT